MPLDGCTLPQPQEKAASGLRLIRKPEVRALTGLSASSLDRLELAGGFPMRVRLGPNSVAWLAAEVRGWIEARAAARGGRAGTAGRATPQGEGRMG
ncbi:MAG: AlpA family phage regulatory protein [Geminicoccaceae bacterium]|nr:AlpA family phage regulatory protein [Geminicoccaceae bacterium]